jgi:hypothetical protein
VSHCFFGPFGSMRRRCFGPHRSLFVSAGPSGNHLRGSCLRGALGVGVEVLTDPTMVVQLPTETTASPRMWVSCTITASEARSLPLMPWFPVCSAFLAPRLLKSLSAMLRRPSSSSTRRGEESPRHPFQSLCSHGIWYSRRPRHGFLGGASQEGSRI